MPSKTGMSIPSVMMRWGRKQAQCKWCEQAVEVGNPIVSVVFWNKGNEDKRSWNKYLYYHPQCWVDQGLDYLNRNPYVPHVRGRKATLSKEDRRKRFLLVRRFNALVQRKGKIKAPYPDHLLIEERITKQMLDIIMDVTNLGGVPKSWVEKL